MTAHDGFRVVCKHCRGYLGESLVELIAVDVVKIATPVALAPPRDIRICAKCRRKVVYVPRADIDRRRAS